MNARILSALCVGTAVTLFTQHAAYAQPAQPSMNDDVAMRQTIKDIRNVGTAMFAWYKDEMAPKASAAGQKAPADPKSADIGAVPVISREELTKILVPKYLPSIPEKDGWGNPYELHLNTTDPNALQVMGLRSAGRDGRFSGDLYVIGPFDPADADQDIPWMDGFFIRWPEAKPAPSQGQ
jgi:hypothetical protein